MAQAKRAKVEEVAPGQFTPRLRIKGRGLVDLGQYETERLAAVAHDVARLIFIHEMRPETDLKTADEGLVHSADSYLVDPLFKQLLASSNFNDVCEALRSGALADQFLCARQERVTRGVSSNTSGDRSTLSRRQVSPPAVPGLSAQQPLQAQQQQQQQQQQQAEQKRQAAPPPPPPFEAAPRAEAMKPAGDPSSAKEAAAAVEATAEAGEEQGRGGSPKKRPMRWVEWPAGCGQYACCISERALKANMTLPAKMKRELFQVSAASAEVQAHDLAHGSAARWTWEVKDYVKDERTSTYLKNLAQFFQHYKAAAGDVMVAVASAPGAVKAMVWKAASKEGIEFLAHLERQASKAAGGAGAGSGGKKRPAESDAAQQQAAKASKLGAGASAPGAAAAAAGAGSGKQRAAESSKRQASSSPDAARKPSKVSAPGARLQHQASTARKEAQQEQQQQSVKPEAGSTAVQAPAAEQQQQQQQQQAPWAEPQQRQAALLALADAGVDPSAPAASGEDTQQLSPTVQVAQSPFRQHGLRPPPGALLAAAAVKQEAQEQPADGAASKAPAAEEGGGAAAAPANGHSPARMSCADASPGPLRQHQSERAAVAGGGSRSGPPPVAGQQGSGGGVEMQLPDALTLANDEDGVYIHTSRLLSLIAATGRIPVEDIAAYRRYFGAVQSGGQRWWHYDSMKQLLDAGEWEQLRQWLCNI